MIPYKGLTDDEVSCIMVVQGTFFGMGYLPRNFDITSEKVIQEYITPYKDNSTIRMLLSSLGNANPEDKIVMIKYVSRSCIVIAL